MMRLFLGIDGGGSGCRARLADGSGLVLGEGRSGPANLASDFDGTCLNITEAALLAAQSAGLPADSLLHMTAVLGLAGGNVAAARARLEQAQLPFAAFAVRSDAETACLGAHGGRDGGILILGTGSQGLILYKGTVMTAGGWGFELSDTGSGAVLGQRALRRALLAHEGIEPASPFTRALMRGFNDDPEEMLAFARQATPAGWAEAAPEVFEAAFAGDAVALELVQGHVRDVKNLLARLAAMAPVPVALMGGLAQPTSSFLQDAGQFHLTAPAGDALDGALGLARRL